MTRGLTMALAAMLVCAAASGMSWRPATRADWRSLDCLVRRIEYVAEHAEDPGVRRCARIALMHLEPMLDRHGGEFRAERAVPIDDYAMAGEDEARLICRQEGNAGRAGNLNDLLDQMGDSTIGRLRRWAASALWASLPWALVVLLVWYTMFYRARARDRALRATFARVERLVADKDERAAAFADADIHREYQRLKPGLARP